MRAKWSFVQYLKKCPQDIIKILHSQEWDGQPENDTSPATAVKSVEA